MFKRQWLQAPSHARVLAVCLLTQFGGPSASAADRVVVIHGSTVVNARLIEPHRQDIERRSGQLLSVVPSKSIHGLMALIEGRAEIAMISTTLSAEIDQLLSKSPSLPANKLLGHEISRTRIGFASHAANPVKRLTLDQVRAVLLGETTNWRDAGGPDLPIAVVTVQPGGGVPTTVRSQLLDGKPFKPGRLIEVESARHVVKIVAQEPGALGVTQLGLLSAPGVAEITTEAPIEQHLMLVTLGEPDDRQRAVIEAIRQIAKASGQ